MSDVPTSEERRNHPGLAELFEQWDRKSVIYGEVECATALARDNGKWQNVITYFLPLNRVQEGRQLARFDYGDILIVRARLSLSSAKSILEELVNHGSLRLPGSPEVRVQATPNGRMCRRVGGHQNRFPVTFATVEYPLQLNPNHVNIPNGLMCAADLPLYP